MSRRVDFDAGARSRLGERWGAEEGKRGSQVPATNALSPRAGASLAFFLAIGLFVGILHGARGRGFLSHVPGRGAVAHGASAAGRGSRGSEVDVRDSVTTAVGVVGALALSFGAAGAELQVPSKQYPTIQSAIDAAADGDVVVLAAGVFTESCVVQGKAIEIRGAGADQTTWVAPVKGRCLEIPEGDASPMAVARIRFTGGTAVANGSAVSLRGSGAKTLTGCRFSENGGIEALVIFGSGSNVSNCQFVSNTTGLTAAFGSGVVIENCLFDSNAQFGASGGGPWVPSDIDFYECDFTVRSTTFRSGFSVGGAPVRVVASGAFEDCRFESGEGGTANAVQSYYGSSVARFSNTVFCGAAAPLFGGSGQFIDDGGNQSLASCTPPCPGDFLADGTVNAADLGILLNFWGTDGSGFPGVDLDGDGIVGAPDLATLLSSWGACPE